jgi:hypothetical protein
MNRYRQAICSRYLRSNKLTMLRLPLSGLFGTPFFRTALLSGPTCTQRVLPSTLQLLVTAPMHCSVVRHCEVQSTQLHRHKTFAPARTIPIPRWSVTFGLCVPARERTRLTTDACQRAKSRDPTSKNSELIFDIRSLRCSRELSRANSRILGRGLVDGVCNRRGDELQGQWEHVRLRGSYRHSDAQSKLCLLDGSCDNRQAMNIETLRAPDEFGPDHSSSRDFVSAHPA